MGMDLCQLGIGEMLGTDLLDIARDTVEAQLLVLVDVRCGQSPTRCVDVSRAGSLDKRQVDIAVMVYGRSLALFGCCGGGVEQLR